VFLHLGVTLPDCTESRFHDAVSRHQQAAQHHLENVADDFDSSDEEEELNDDEILTSVVKNFSVTSGKCISDYQ